jgi:[calcium/calmodulin-dependent protein kinase] kinase
VKIINKKQEKKKNFFQKDKEGKSKLNQIYQEIAIMKKLSHDNILLLHEIIEDNEREVLYIIMDLAE